MSVSFKSTRGAESVSFEEALLRGLAPDGGLYIPESIPPAAYQAARSSRSIADFGVGVLRHWVSRNPPGRTLDEVVHDALNFPVPLVPLDGEWQGVHVLELFHGPTLSFKDFGARTMARWMASFLERSGERVTILVATSGDTGSAVADGFAGSDRIDVVLLYPRGKVSPVQERQLIVERPGVHALAVEGDFDDCQRMVKEAFQDRELSGRRLSSANSINIGRLLPQMLYYGWAVRTLDAEDVRFCVPSGNLGNLTGGVLAYLSGMPASGFIAAHNANDYFPRFLSGDAPEPAATVRTLSNAMDVGLPSNFERLRALLEPHRLRSLIEGTSVSDEETLASIRRVYRETGYLADPHTAVGLEAARRLRKENQPVVVLSTAHPAKFPETIERAVGITPETPPRLAELWDREVFVERIAPTVDALRDAIVSVQPT